MADFHFPSVGVTVTKYEGVMPSSLIRRLRLIGMDFVEFNSSIFPEIDKVVENIGSLKTAFHLPIVTDEGWDFSCAKFQKDIDAATTLLNRYKEALNIQHLICHPPEAGANSQKLESSLGTLKENLSRLEIPIHLENVPSIGPAEFDQIYKELDDSLADKLLGICFDAPHFFIKGIDPISQFKKLNGRITSIHLSDCVDDRDEHIPFNSGGTLPVKDFLQAVRETNFNRFITLEIRPVSLDDIKSYINSYLTTLQYVNPKKYRTSRLRIFALRPLLKRFVA